MTYNLLTSINRIFNLLSYNHKLIFKNKNLLDYSDSEITTPVGNIIPLLLKYKSKLPAQPIEFELLKQLIIELTNKQSIVRLNHIGFCYKVTSQEKEKKRLIELIKQTKFHLYQEKSNDYGLWLYVGNTNKWEEPLIEMLPVEKTNDKWVDYWLPHIQIDIDTTLTSPEIENQVISIYSKTTKPQLFTIDGIVYVVRSYLGIIDGINIYLDLATNSRKVKFHRQNLLTRIS